MSFALTTKQVREGTKTVTRRMGWRFVNIGDIICAVEKCQGLKKGEKIQRIRNFELIDKRYEPLYVITPQDVILEGFPDLTTDEFIAIYCKTHKGCTPETEITRLEYKYV